MGVWKCGDNMTAVTHPADTTASFFLALLRGEYGARVTDPTHLVVAVNAFWSGAGEKVGQPWEFGLKKEAKEVLGREGDWDKVYVCRRVRSAAGMEGTLRWGARGGARGKESAGALHSTPIRFNPIRSPPAF